MGEQIAKMYAAIKARAEEPPQQTRVQFDDAPHPWYGPCDAFGGNGKWCAECRRVIEDQEVLLNFIHEQFEKALQDKHGEQS